MRRFGSLLFTTIVCAFGAVAACSSADAKPPAASDSLDGSSGGSGGGDSDGGDSGDASKDYPASCRNTTKDNTETDVDCGGPDCAPCKLGQSCTAPSDCEDAGATCDNMICALCNDGKPNGSETDTDCGGIACGVCSVGKKCKVASDCSSKICGTDFTCACPDPTMVHISLGGDLGAFCVDRTEVTNGQYNQFISAHVNTSDQKVASCKASNASFVPISAWPPHTAPVTASGNSLAFNMGLPVHYVDWCDAYGYCDWAGKRLCGTLDGQSLAPADFKDFNKSAWYNTCTAQGQALYPYGSTFDSSLCDGAGTGGQGPDPSIMKDVVGAHYGVDSNGDHGIYEIVTASDDGNISGVEHELCQGGTVGIFQMSGNVAEWEDSCDSADATSPCRLRGGSYAANNDPAALACAADRKLARIPTDGATSLADVGFRCCAY